MDEDHRSWHSKWDASWVYKQNGDSTGRNGASWNRRWQDRLQERVDRLSIERENLRKRLGARREVGDYLEARLKAATDEVEELRRSSGVRGRESQAKLERAKADEKPGEAAGAKAAEEAKAAAEERVAKKRRAAEAGRTKAAAKAKLSLGESYETLLRRARAEIAAQTINLEARDEGFRRRVTNATGKWKVREPGGASTKDNAVVRFD